MSLSVKPGSSDLPSERAECSTRLSQYKHGGKDSRTHNVIAPNKTRDVPKVSSPLKYLTRKTDKVMILPIAAPLR